MPTGEPDGAGQDASTPIDLDAMDEIIPGAWLAPGHQMVVNDRLVQHRWFAHRVTQRELVAGWLDVVPDFAAVAAFARRYTLASGDEVHVVEPDAEELAPHELMHLVLRGPDGWLDGAPADGMVMLSVDGGRLLMRWETRPPTTVDPGSVLAVFERLGGGGPVPLLDLVLHLLIDHPVLFAADPAPFGDLLRAGTLEVDGTTVRRTDVRPAARGAQPAGVAGLGLESSVAADRLLAAVVTESDDPVGAELLAALRDPEAVSALAERLVGGAQASPDQLARFLDRMAGSGPDAHGPGPAFLLLRLAEWRGDTAGHDAALDDATTSNEIPAALVDAAWFASDRGDARAALALLRAAHVPNDDPDAQLLARYTAAGPRLVGRNSPCWCGSTRKHKQCCLRLNGHDLASRAPWLYAKAVTFLQRPPQRPGLFTIAIAHAGVTTPDDAPARVIAAACDATVTDLCLAEGGTFERFVEKRGHLLPDDERALAESWRGARHRIWEVVDGGRALRDHVNGDERTLDARSTAKLPGEGLVLAAIHDGPLALPGVALPIDDGVLNELVPLLDAGAAAPIAAVLGREFGWTAAPDVGSPADREPDALAAAP